MKRIVFAVLLGVASMSSINSQAQVSVSINIGQQPSWGPTGYDHVDYYYLPDVDAYYYVPTQQYIYLNNGAWVWRNSLPARFSNYDLYSGYKVVMNSPKPYLSHKSHLTQYSRYKNVRGKQQIIRDSRDVKYTNARNARPAENNRSVARPNGGQPRVVKGKSDNDRNDRGNDSRGNSNSRNDQKGRGSRG
jgi:hypothetical protein